MRLRTMASERQRNYVDCALNARAIMLVQYASCIVAHACDVFGCIYI